MMRKAGTLCLGASLQTPGVYRFGVQHLCVPLTGQKLAVAGARLFPYNGGYRAHDLEYIQAVHYREREELKALTPGHYYGPQHQDQRGAI
jgi:hypothetical protein